jgi:hypothetical protein
MAEKKTPPKGFLGQFNHPLWRVAKLDNLRAVSIVEGRRDAFAFTVLELEHRETGLLANQTSLEISTIFIVHLSKTSPCWAITDTPPDVKTWVDDRHVYLSRLGRRTPVKDWSYLLEQAVAVAETLVEKSSQDGNGETDRRPARVSEGVDVKWVAFWFSIAGIIPLLEWMTGVSVITTILQKGYYSYCKTGNPSAVLRVGSDAWLFGLALCLPVLGHIACIAQMVRYYGRPGFAWRMSLTGVATLALGFAGLTIAFKYTTEMAQLKDGTTIPCVSTG